MILHPRSHGKIKANHKCPSDIFVPKRVNSFRVKKGINPKVMPLLF
jgi:hypothetical protein